jgi:hypothetical protein
MLTEQKRERLYRLVWPELPDGDLRLTNLTKDARALAFFAGAVASGFLACWTLIQTLTAVTAGLSLGMTAVWTAWSLLGFALMGAYLRQTERQLRAVEATDNGLEEVSV